MNRTLTRVHMTVTAHIPVVCLAIALRCIHTNMSIIHYISILILYVFVSHMDCVGKVFFRNTNYIYICTFLLVDKKDYTFSIWTHTLVHFGWHWKLNAQRRMLFYVHSYRHKSLDCLLQFVHTRVYFQWISWFIEYYVHLVHKTIDINQYPLFSREKLPQFTYTHKHNRKL